jgi:hypothetical protein
MVLKFAKPLESQRNMQADRRRNDRMERHGCHHEDGTQAAGLGFYGQCKHQPKTEMVNLTGVRTTFYPESYFGA